MNERVLLHFYLTVLDFLSSPSTLSLLTDPLEIGADLCESQCDLPIVVKQLDASSNITFGTQ